MTEALVKVRALSYLVDHRRQTRSAPWTVEPDVTAGTMGRRLGVPLHDLVHVLWDLQKQDAIRFRERKYARGTVGRGDLDRFVVTRAGLQLLEGLPPAPPPAPVNGTPVVVPKPVREVLGQAMVRASLPPLPPELVELYRWRAQRVEAEALAGRLDALGADDLGVMVLDRMGALTPLAAAILGYLDALGVSPPVSPSPVDTAGHDEHERDATGRGP